MDNSSPSKKEAIICYINTFLPLKNHCQQLKDLSDGLIFSTILKQANGFRFNFGQINQRTQNKFEKIHNIRIIIKKVQQYFNNKLGKGIKTKDINVIEIAHNSKDEEIIKLFDIVLGVLTQAPNKQEHIQKILSLNQQKQKIFIQIIQNITENRILQFNQTQQDKSSFVIQQIQAQNLLLKQQIIKLQNQKELYFKELEYFKMRVTKEENQFQNNLKSYETDPEQMNYNTLVHNQQLKGLIQNLRKKISKIQRQRQNQVCILKCQISQQEKKIQKLQKYSQICQFYQQKYNQSEELIAKARIWQKQKSKMNRIIQQKDNTIKKVQEKMDQLWEQNCGVQERQIYLQMELQKRQIRFKQLQKQVKKRMNVGDESTFSNSLDMKEIEKEEIEDIKQELQKMKINERQSFKETHRLKREAQKYKNIEKEKKKLENIILELSRQKKSQVQILLGVVGDLTEENKKYRSLLQTNKIQIN